MKASKSRRPTIEDVAKAAEVSVSTVDRVINARNPVKSHTSQRVLQAAQELGFHAVPTIRQRIKPERPAKTLGFLLLQKQRTFYQLLAGELAKAAAASPLIQGAAHVAYMEDLDPPAVAREIEKLARHVDAMAVVAANHPLVSAAVEQVSARVPVTALISEITAAAQVGYAGLDNYKAGRTAAWAIASIAKGPGKVGILVGSHRFRCQDLNEMGFRSYFREHAPEFTLLEPLATLEAARYGAEVTRDLLARVPDLRGLYVAGGGVSGVLASLREMVPPRAIAAAGMDLTQHTQAGLLDGYLAMVISHPLEQLCQSLVAGMAEQLTGRTPAPRTSILPFVIHTPENL